MRFHCFRNARFLFLAVALVMFGTAQARSDYLLDAGDVLEIAVYGVADFSRRSNVNIDGNVAVPFLGEVQATGLSIADLRKELERGLEEAGAFENPHVTIELVEHRPFYISGDVLRPGAHPFRPGLTVRHAIALAGGYDTMRYRTENPLLDVPELRSRYELLWIDLITRQARVAVVRDELAARDQFDASVLYDAPLSRSTIDELAGLEKEESRIRLAEYRDEVDYQEDAIDQAIEVVETLEKVVTEQEASVALQVSAADRAVSNSARGVMPGIRVDEEQRAVAYLRAQHMDAVTRLMTARQEVYRQRRDLGKVASEHNQRLIGELRESVSEIERIKFQLRSVGEQLVHTRAMGATAAQGEEIIAPELTIIRSNDGVQERVAVTEDSPMRAGDVLDVALARDNHLVLPGY